MPEDRLKALEARYDHDIVLIVQDAVHGLNAILDRLDAYAHSSAEQITVPFDTHIPGESLSQREDEKSSI